MLIAEVDEISTEMAADLGGISRHEWAVYGDARGRAFVRGSDHVREVWEGETPCFIFGLYRPIMVDLPQFWALFTSHYLRSTRLLVETRRKAEGFFHSYPAFYVQFRPWQTRRIKFARVMGLREYSRADNLVIYGRP